MSDTVDQIKSRLDIVDVVSGYIKVQKAGANWKARCPFHNEKTPSFIISPERQSWHCFGCSKGGDMFSFVQEIEGVEFPDALRTLAAKAGVELPQWRPGDRAARDERQRLLAVAELSTRFFEKQLWHGAAGAKALAYLRGRGLTDDTIRTWRLGWAPNDWRALTGFLQREGHPDADIVAAGMAAEKKGRIYDRFRSRIMFPICDQGGQVVGFTGRVFGAEVAVDGEPLAKYVNTPQTTIYDKSRTLFGLHHAKLAMRSRDAAVLVEGNVDAIMSWQSGAENVVATSGTALTTHQLRMLARYTTNLDFCFDADQAGAAATRRGIGAALAANFAVRVVSIDDPDCKDPAEYVAKHGAGWGVRVAAAKPALQYYYDRVLEGYDPSSVQSKKAALASLGPLIRRLTSRVEQSHWVGQLAALLRTDHASVQTDIAAVRDDIAAAERGAEPETVPAVPAASPAPVDPLSVELLTLAVRAPELRAQAVEAADLCDPRVAALLREPDRLDAAADPERHLVDVAHMRAGEFYGSAPPAELAAGIGQVIARLKERDLRARCAELEPRIRQAEQEKNPSRVRELLDEFRRYTEELQRLRSVQSPPIA